MWDDDDLKTQLRRRIVRLGLQFVFLLPIVALTIWSPLPIAWYLDGGRASIATEPEGPQSGGEVEAIVHTVGTPESCGTTIAGPIILFIGRSDRSADRTVALGLAPTAGGLGVRAMDLPSNVTDWTNTDSGTGTVLLAQDPSAAVLPAPRREGSYWRIQGSVSYVGEIYASRAIAPIGVATQSAGILTATMEPGNPNVATTVEVDIRWLAARRGPFGLPVYCW